MKNLEIGFRTKHYQLIYQDGKVLDNLLDLPRGSWAYASLKVHLEKYHHSKSHNIWYDEKNNLCFSQAQCKRDGVPGKDHHFLDFKDAFLSGYYGIEYTKWGHPDPFENVPFLGNEDIIYSEHKRLLNREGKSILIICGGPSVNSVSWENLNYDSVWSCNQFYLNEKIKNKKLDLVTVAPGLIDVNGDEQFIDYIKEYNPLVSFEIEQGCRIKDEKNYQEALKFCRLHKNDVSFFHTRYRGQPGLGLRMVVYAIYLGYKDISFVGIDGRSRVESDGNLLHAFSGDKPIPNWYRRFGDDFQERQFIIFWDYIMELKDQFSFEINNLGEGTEYNVLSRLFSESFPLPKNVKEGLSGTP